jgi:hypothetical protein
VKGLIEGVKMSTGKNNGTGMVQHAMNNRLAQFSTFKQPELKVAEISAGKSATEGMRTYYLPRLSPWVLAALGEVLGRGAGKGVRVSWRYVLHRLGSLQL